MGQESRHRCSWVLCFGSHSAAVRAGVSSEVQVLIQAYIGCWQNSFSYNYRNHSSLLLQDSRRLCHRGICKGLLSQEQPSRHLGHTAYPDEGSDCLTPFPGPTTLRNGARPWHPHQGPESVSISEFCPLVSVWVTYKQIDFCSIYRYDKTGASRKLMPTKGCSVPLGRG